MIETVIHYRCPTCKSVYDTIDETQSCCDSHCLPEDFKVAVASGYSTGYSRAKKFPNMIILESRGGATAPYQQMVGLTNERVLDAKDVVRWHDPECDGE